MYNVTSQYRQAIKNEVQVTKVRGIIGTIPFNMDNIMRDSFSISNQCTDTNDVVLGSCYIGQLNATFTGIEIPRTEWMNKTIVPYFQMWYDSQNFDEIPLGVYTIKEVSHTAEGVEVTAYDNMCKFDKKFKKTGLNMVAHPYDFLTVFCQKCGVSLGMTQNEVEALPNGTANLYLCGVRKSTTTYANDIETYRDALFWLAQCMACFATMDRSGALVLRAYKDSFDDYINDTQRLSGAKFADYITSYTGIYTESLYDGEVTYYGYDLATLQQMRDTAMQQLEQIITDLAELEEEYAQGQITEEEYKAEKKRLTSEKKAKEKYISWLDKMIAQAQAEGDGAYMDLGANPFFQRRDANIPSIADATLATTLRSHILSALGKIEYTPFTCSSVFGVHYDLGDVIQFTGGHADDDHGCIMSYEWTLHGQYNMEGYGVNPDEQNVKTVDKKQSERAQQNALSATRNTTGTDLPVSPNDGDIHVVVNKITDEPLQMQYAHTVTSSGHPCDINNFSGNYKDGYSFSITGVPDGSDHGEHAYFDLQGLTDGVEYKVEFDGQFTQASGGWMHSGYSDGLYIGGTWLCTYPADLNEHHYSVTFTYHTGEDINFLFYRVTDNNYYTYAVSNMKFTPVNGAIQGMEASVGGEWQNIDYVRTISQTQTSSGGEKIATANNSDGTSTDIYAKKVEANPSGSGTANLEKIQIGDIVYELAAGGNDVGLSVGSNGAIQSTYADGTEQTEDILRDDTGEDIATILDSIASEMRLLNQPEVYAPVIYSTTEREVGVWTDGKPLYQKTFAINYSTEWQSQYFATGSITNSDFVSIERIIDAFGHGSTAMTQFSAVKASANADTISVYGNLQDTFTDITLLYTKTTDVAGSGHYAALGVPAVHYDDTERVIGTYFGKPLYRKAWTGQSIFLQWQGGSTANYTTGTWQNNDVADMKLLVNLKLIGANGLCDTPMGTKSASTTITLFSKIQDTYDTIILEYTKTTD